MEVYHDISLLIEYDACVRISREVYCVSIWITPDQIRSDERTDKQTGANTCWVIGVQKREEK